MAEKIKGNWKARQSEDHYPWSKWGDGDTWRIKQGEDYHSSNWAMANTIYAAARRVGMRATVQKNIPGQITFRFIEVPIKAEIRHLKGLKG